MKNKIFVFDYIRSLSVFFIIVCHCCFSFNETVWLGRYLGQTFNFTFIILSSILLGLSYKKRDRPKYPISFLKKRIKRLITSYYPFLLVMFIFLYVSGYNIKAKDIIMHIILLPWFDKLPGFEHLWYITIITLCYFCIFFISNIYHYTTKLTSIIVLLILLYFLIQTPLYSKSIPAYGLLYMLLYSLIFIKACSIINFINSINIFNITILTLIINTIIISLYFLYNIFEYKSISYPLSIISSLTIFAFLYKFLFNAKENIIISFISKISFEIYLVHHIFCLGKYSIFKNYNLHFITAFAIILSITITLAFILNYISKHISFSTITNIISKKHL